MLNVLPTWKFETPQKITNSVERTNHGCQQQYGVGERPKSLKKERNRERKKDKIKEKQIEKEKKKERPKNIYINIYIYKERQKI